MTEETAERIAAALENIAAPLEAAAPWNVNVVSGNVTLALEATE